MVREFGLSPELGPVGYPEGGSVFLGGGGPGMSSRPYSEATQAAVDKEVSRLLREAEERAVALLRGHREELDALVALLLERETVDGGDVYRLAGLADKSAVPGAATIAEPARAHAAHPAPSEALLAAALRPLVPYQRCRAHFGAVTAQSAVHAAMRRRLTTIRVATAATRQAARVAATVTKAISVPWSATCAGVSGGLVTSPAGSIQIATAVPFALPLGTETWPVRSAPPGVAHRAGAGVMPLMV
jgi:hypothetical protein